MPLTIGSNIASLKTQRALSKATDALSTTYERLSSGQRINKASDDAAGLAIKDSLTARARVLTAATRNMSDGISALQIADSAYESLQAITTRQAELAEQAANGAYSYTQRVALNKESHALTREYNRIVATTKFNGIALLNPGAASIVLQTGYGSDTLTFNFAELSARAIGTGTFNSSSLVLNSSVEDGALADIDGDGDLDFLAVDGNPWFGISTNNGSGAFTTTTIGVSGITLTGAIDTGNINSTGGIDVAVTANPASGPQNVLLFSGNGNGTFGLQQVISTSLTAITDAILEDLDGDGIDELIVVGRGEYSQPGIQTGGIQVFKSQNGSYSLSYEYLQVEGVPGPAAFGFGAVAIGDVNGDGIKDIVASGTHPDPWIGTFLGSAGGGFQAPIATLQTYINSFSLSLADLNNDGRDEVVIAGQTGFQVSSFANGTYTNVMTGNFSTLIGAVGTGDINGDGIDDVYISEGVGSYPNYVIYGQDGSLPTTLNQLQNGTNLSSNSLIGDINGDGVPDLLRTRANEVLIQNTILTATIPYADLLSTATSRSALDSHNAQTQTLSRGRGAIGSLISRLESRLSATKTEILASNDAIDRISSADIAAESAALIKTQITQSVASAVLAQANLEPRLALELLKG